MLAELLEHVVEERDAGRDRASCPCRRRRASRSTVVSFVSRRSSACRCAHVDHLRQDRAERGEERVVLGGRADRDAQAAFDAAATTRSRAPARRASSSRFHRSCASPSTRTSRKFAPDGTTVEAGQLGERREQPAPLLDQRRDPLLHLAAEVERDRARDLRRHRQVVRQQHLLELGDHPRRARPRSRAAPRPATTPSSTCARRRAAGRRRRARARSTARTRRRPRRRRAARRPRPRRRAAARRSRAARRCRSGCSGCTRTRPTAASRAISAAAASASIV